MIYFLPFFSQKSQLSPEISLRIILLAEAATLIFNDNVVPLISLLSCVYANIYDDFDNKQISLFPSAVDLIPHKIFSSRYGFVPIIIVSQQWGINRAPSGGAVAYQANTISCGWELLLQAGNLEEKKGKRHTLLLSSSKSPRFHLFIPSSRFFSSLLAPGLG